MDVCVNAPPLRTTPAPFKEDGRETVGLGACGHHTTDFGQGGAAVNLRLARAEQVERRPVEDVNRQVLGLFGRFGQGGSGQGAFPLLIVAGGEYGNTQASAEFVDFQQRRDTITASQGRLAAGVKSATRG